MVINNNNINFHYPIDKTEMKTCTYIRDARFAYRVIITITGFHSRPKTLICDSHLHCAIYSVALRRYCSCKGCTHRITASQMYVSICRLWRHCPYVDVVHWTTAISYTASIYCKYILIIDPAISVSMFSSRTLLQIEDFTSHFYVL